jgi:hypothetical protein
MQSVVADFDAQLPPHFVVDARGKEFIVAHDNSAIFVTTGQSGSTIQMAVDHIEEYLDGCEVFGTIGGAHWMLLFSSSSLRKSGLTSPHMLRSVYFDQVQGEPLFACLRRLHGIELDVKHPRDLLRNVAAQHGREAIHMGFRHRDFHCDNCLISKANFKLIDVGDSGMGLLYCDIARMEMSILTAYCRGPKFELVAMNGIDIDRPLIQSSSSMALPEELMELLNRFRSIALAEMSIQPSEFEIALAYYLEVASQLFYAVTSPLSLPAASATIINEISKSMEVFTK